MNSDSSVVNHEREVQVQKGSIMLTMVLALLLGGLALLIYSIVAGTGHPVWHLFAISLLSLLLGAILAGGFFTLQPNEARVLILFGRYKGTVRQSGFHWGNPFYASGPGIMAELAEVKRGDSAGKGQAQAAAARPSNRNKVSLRARTHNVERLKVNDKRGNPIEIAAVLVWRVRDTAQALFDVDDYEKYVQMQSESALRHLASIFPYDHGEDNEPTLRTNVDEVSQSLRAELQERLIKAGLTVEETRLTHLAYAPEIAQAMLRRQQAEAVIAARQKIVVGAVSMVEMALKDLADKKVVELDDDRRAAMVSNLMVVLCGETEVHPVINTGTLYA